jgi:NAD(P)-dependent dehydrogenase (short-subunit alcohol dehydrogenase family)
MGQFVLDWKVQASGAPPAEITDATARQTLLGRNATEADVAGAVLFFLSEEASFVTGVSMDVDGGMRLGFIPGAG